MNKLYDVTCVRYTTPFTKHTARFLVNSDVNGVELEAILKEQMKNETLVLVPNLVSHDDYDSKLVSVCTNEAVGVPGSHSVISYTYNKPYRMAIWGKCEVNLRTNDIGLEDGRRVIWSDSDHGDEVIVKLADEHHHEYQLILKYDDKNYLVSLKNTVLCKQHRKLAIDEVRLKKFIPTKHSTNYIINSKGDAIAVFCKHYGVHVVSIVELNENGQCHE